MERLTKRINDVVTYIGTENEYDTGMISAETASSVAAVREILLRLAAYEDTGLTPEEIHKAYGELCLLESALKNYGSHERMKELAEADKAGRLAVLPCRVGEKIYYINGKYIIEVEVVGYKVDETGAWLFIGETYNPETNRAYHCDLETERIGKNVFFTREEAEWAMEGRKDD